MTQKYGTNVYAPVVAGNDTTDDMAVAFTEELQGATQHFKTIAERDAWGTAYKSRVFNTIAIVDADENGFVQTYRWDGVQEDGSDGKWVEYDMQGVVMSDSDGAIPKNIKTVVFGPGFAIQQAGDQEDAALVTYTPAAQPSSGGAGTVQVGKWGGSYENYEVHEINIQYPLTIAPQRPGADKPASAVLIGMQHGVYEAHHGEARLAYFDMDEVILGGVVKDKRRGAIWADAVAYGANNMALTDDMAKKSVHLQDPYNDDPSVSGGAAMLCMLHLNFYGKAHDDGEIEVYRINADTGDVLVDDAGKPIGAIHHYKRGDKISAITIAQVYMAKGIVNAQWVVKHTFSDEPIRMQDWDVGGSCMLDMYIDKESVSPALNEVQNLLNVPIRIQRKYYGQSLASNVWEFGFDIPEATLTDNRDADSVLGVILENPTTIVAKLQNGILHIKDNGTDMAYFNTGLLLSEEDTTNLRGKEVDVYCDVSPKDTSLHLHMFVFTDEAVKAKFPILVGELNENPVLSEGWVSVDNTFAAEDATGKYVPLGKRFTIPDNATLVMFGIVPNKQLPLDVYIKSMTINASKPFTAHEVSIPLGLDSIPWGHETVSFVTYPGKMWVVGKNRTNLPFGEKVSGKPNDIAEMFAKEDDSNIYDGGLKLNKVTDYTIEVWLNVQNTFNIDMPSREQIIFEVEDSSGVISTAPFFELVKGDFNQHLVKWSFTYSNKLAGTELKLYGTAPVARSAYLVDGTYAAAGVIVTARALPQNIN